MNSQGAVRLDIEDTIATVLLNRPEALNAFNTDIWVGLQQAAQGIKENPTIRVAIITGAGDKAFSAGLDLKGVASEGGPGIFSNYREGYDTQYSAKLIPSMYEELPVPVIAAVNGYCLGVGMELSLCCDIRLAADTAVFALPEVQLGLIPDVGGTQRLPRIVGLSKAKELIYTGRRIDAAEALRIGLVDHVYSKEQLMTEARKLAEEIARFDPSVIYGAKRAINSSMSVPLDVGLKVESDIMFSTRSDIQFREGAERFAKKQ